MEARVCYHYQRVHEAFLVRNWIKWAITLLYKNSINTTHRNIITKATADTMSINQNMELGRRTKLSTWFWRQNKLDSPPTKVLWKSASNNRSERRANHRANTENRHEATSFGRYWYISYDSGAFRLHTNMSNYSVITNTTRTQCNCTGRTSSLKASEIGTGWAMMIPFSRASYLSPQQH